ncbi:hypothetical protein Tco_0700637 [Tanacetum coccineum]
MLKFEAYMTYRAYATGEKTPKPKTTKKKVDFESSPKTKSTQASKGKRIMTLAKGDKLAKKKQSATKSKDLTVLSEVALTEAQQIKIAIERSKIQTHSSHASGSSDGVDIQSKVPDEQQQNISRQMKELVTNQSQGEDDEDNDENDSENNNDDQENISGEIESDNDRDDFVHPNLSTYKADDQEEEKANDDDDVSSDQMVSTPPDYEITEEEENQDDDDNVMVGEQEDEEDEELYGDLNLNLERQDAKMMDAQVNQEKEEMKDEVNVAIQLKSNKLREEAQAENKEFLNKIESNIKAIIKDQVKAHVKAQVSKILLKVEKFVTESLGAEVLARSSNQPQTSYAAAASLSQFELKKILIDKINENKSMSRSDVQKNLYNALIESYNSDKDLFASYSDVVTLKRGCDDQDKDEEPSVGSNRGTKRRRSGKEESLKEATQMSKSTKAEEHGPRVDYLEEPSYQEFETGNDDVSPARELAQDLGTQSSFNEFLATPIDFSPFILNRLKINNLTEDVLTGLNYNLMKGTCKSVVELEYHLEELFKATHDQLDWYNPEGRSYPHDLSKPLPLIQNARGRQVIPFDHFINNNLEYLKGGILSQRYTTSITKTKAAKYSYVKWIEDKFPRSIWSSVQVVYDKHAYWGTYHWGPKCQSFYGYATNMETLKDVYSRHRIIVVTSLKIMEFFGYKHLEEIIVLRQDDQLYKFQEGDFKRLCRQDIEDMLLLLV